MNVPLHGVYVAGNGELVGSSIYKFYFDEFFEISEGAFCGEGRCNGGGLIGLNGSFGVI